MKIVTICGSLHSGKSLVKDMISDRVPVAWLPFAKPVKDVAFHMGWDGQKDKKGRKLLQLLGTECGRRCIDEDIWADKWQAKALEFAKDNNIVLVADDMRFDNEVNTVLRLALGHEVYIIEIYRPQGLWMGIKRRYFPFLLHPSERPLKLKGLNTYKVVNDGSIEDLRAAIEPLLLQLEC